MLVSHLIEKSTIIERFLFWLCVICLAACVKPVKENETIEEVDTVLYMKDTTIVITPVNVPLIDPVTLRNSIRQRMDSVFQIDGKTFTVNLLHYDFTDIAIKNGDTLKRPTYACVVKITDANKKVIFTDSLLRNTWGCKGNVRPIDEYILVPEDRWFVMDDGVIVLPFIIYEENSADEIDAMISFNVQTFSSNRIFLGPRVQLQDVLYEYKEYK